MVYQNLRVVIENACYLLTFDCSLFPVFQRGAGVVFSQRLIRPWRKRGVSPTGSACGGKTVVSFKKDKITGEVPEWFNGAVSKTVVP